MIFWILPLSCNPRFDQIIPNTKEYIAPGDPIPPTPTVHPLSDCDSGCEQFESEGIDPGDEYWQISCMKNVVITTHVKESDGLVLAESASYIAGATVNEGSPRVDGQGNYSKADFVLYGSIHMQMRNDRNMREKLEGVKQVDSNGVTTFSKGLYRGYYGTHFKIN